MILCADIGGTNARLAIAARGTANPVAERQYACADYPAFEPILADYLAATGADIHSACLALAGPIDDGGQRARLTNLPWIIDAEALASRFGIKHLCLANDFAAAAMGVTAAPAEHLVSLQAGEPLAGAPRLVIGAGTGLGMAILVREQGTSWRVLPGEGGHIGFAPQDEDQVRIWQALYALYGRVTTERVVSGPGLASIHQILTGQHAEPAEITRLALSDDNLAARRSTDTFLAAYGAFAGDMAMLAMARGGVFLAGGIAPKILPLFSQSRFLSSFNAKGEHEALAQRMPVVVVSDPVLGLRGAALLAGA